MSASNSSSLGDIEEGLPPPSKVVENSASISNVNRWGTSPIGRTSSRRNESEAQSTDGVINYSSSGDLTTSTTSRHNQNRDQSPNEVVIKIASTGSITVNTSPIDPPAPRDQENRVEQPDQVANNRFSNVQMFGLRVHCEILLDPPAPRDQENRAEQRDEVGNNRFSTGEEIDVYFEKCVPLQHAAIGGNWQEARKILPNDSALWSEPITKDGETLLHIAAAAGQTKFVKRLLKRPEITYDSLKQLDDKKRTPFARAVIAGAKEIVELMLNYKKTNTDDVNRNKELLTIRAQRDTSLLYYAALYGRCEMADFLYGMPQTKENLRPLDVKHVFFACMDAGLYGVALKLLDEKPESQLATARHSRECTTALHILARNPSAFYSHATKFNICVFWKPKPGNALSLARRLWNVMKKEDNKLDLIREPTPLLFDAVESGNFQLLEMLITSDPGLAWVQNREKQTIFHVAVKYRQADIFSLIYKIGPIKDVINSYEDKSNKNNMLHYAAMLPPPGRLNVIPGAALQMQQELLWYKEVKKVIDPELRDKRNGIQRNGQTPKELFLVEHESLLKDGEKWMKNRAQSCTIVASLIATVVFATAFTVPGGNDQANGLAIFLNKTGSTLPFLKRNPYLFDIFTVSAATALGASTISITLFLSILTSPYSYQEFLGSLPRKLLMGLITLLISNIGMVSAFCVAFMLAYAENTKLIPWIVIGIEVLPIVSFVILQGRLFYQVFCSTYFSKLFFPPKEVNL